MLPWVFAWKGEAQDMAGVKEWHMTTHWVRWCKWSMIVSLDIDYRSVTQLQFNFTTRAWLCVFFLHHSQLWQHWWGKWRNGLATLHWQSFINFHRLPTLRLNSYVEVDLYHLTAGCITPAPGMSVGRVICNRVTIWCTVMHILLLPLYIHTVIYFSAVLVWPFWLHCAWFSAALLPSLEQAQLNHLQPAIQPTEPGMGPPNFIMSRQRRAIWA